MSAHPIDEKAIFNIARRIDSAEARAEYLQQVCGTDLEALQRVAELLQVYEREQSFLESPAVAVTDTLDLTPVEKPGTVIGPYKLLQQIGEGGMGVVYMAEQTEPVQRRVALKIIKPGMDTRQVIARFEAERQALAMMDHPNIARVLDAGTTGSGRPYFVMELVKGVSITRYCDENHLAPRQRLELFVPVCHAAQHAHQKGVIHRDIKPSNVLVAKYDDRPVPKIIDFGVAKAIEHRLTEKTMFTQFGQVVGTVEYMSPEQADLNQLDIDTRSDIYSLGVLLYELLTGETPLDRRRLRSAAFDEMLRIIREEEPPRPSTRLSTSESLPSIAANRQTEPKKLNALVRGELDWIVMKALEKDRTRRYESASAFAADVERYLAHDPVQARPPTLADRAAKWARRHRPVAWSAAVLLALSTVTLALSTVLIAQARREAMSAYEETAEQLGATERAEQLAKQQERLAKEQRKLAEAQREEAVKQREISERNLYLAHMRLAQRDWEQGQVARLHSNLDSHLPRPGQPDPRGWEWYYYLSLCHRDLLTLKGHTQSVAFVAWSPDGRRLASVSDDTVRVWDAASGQEVYALHHAAGANSAVWSPDGRRLASSSADGTVKIWDAGTGKEIRTLRHNDANAGNVAWSPEGGRLACGFGDRVKIWDAVTGQEIRSLAGDRRWFASVTWSPDGRSVAATNSAGITVWDASTGKEIRTLRGKKASPHRAAWSPDGRRLVSAARRVNEMSIWDAATGKEVVALKDAESTAFAVAWSPDGRWVASGGTAATVRVFDAATGESVRAFRGHMSTVWWVAWSPDSRRIASASGDGTIKVWDTAQEPEPCALPGSKNSISTWDWNSVVALGWSPDGRRLAARSDKGVNIWEVAGGRGLRILTRHDPG